MAVKIRIAHDRLSGVRGPSRDYLVQLAFLEEVPRRTLSLPSTGKAELCQADRSVAVPFQGMEQSSSSEADLLLPSALGHGTTPRAGIFHLWNKALEICIQVLLLSLLFSKHSGFSCSSYSPFKAASDPSSPGVVVSA